MIEQTKTRFFGTLRATSCEWSSDGPTSFDADGHLICCGKEVHGNTAYCEDHLKRAYIQDVTEEELDAMVDQELSMVGGLGLEYDYDNSTI